MLCPVTFCVAVPGEHLHGHSQISADFRKFLAASLDILPFEIFLLAGDALFPPVFPVVFALPAFFIVVAPADRLQQLVHIIGLIHEFRA